MKKSMKTIMLGGGGSDTCPLTLRGFGASYNNVWFAPTSAWVVNIGSISLNYNLNKRMICNYSIINN